MPFIFPTCGKTMLCWIVDRYTYMYVSMRVCFQSVANHMQFCSTPWNTTCLGYHVFSNAWKTSTSTGALVVVSANTYVCTYVVCQSLTHIMPSVFHAVAYKMLVLQFVLFQRVDNRGCAGALTVVRIRTYVHSFKFLAFKRSSVFHVVPYQ